MIPIRLTLSNFLSYGEAPQTLNFQNFKIACLIGANGMGKSALLDAMTWALWGEARKASQSKNVKAAKFIVRNNASHAFVEFDFEVEGNYYRIRRSADVRPNKFTEKVYLQVIDIDGNVQSELSDLSKNETDAKIVEFLGLDYETFLNSAYLAQGKADEFTKKNAKDRVEIIRKVLNLDRYTRYEEEAKRRLSQIKGENLKLIGKIESLESHVAEEGTRQAAFEHIATQLTEVQSKLGQQKEHITQLQAQEADINRQADWVDNLQKNVTNLQKELLLQQQEIEKHQAKIVELERLKSQEAEIRAQYLAYEAINLQYEPLVEKQQKATALKNELLQETTQLNQTKYGVESALQKLKHQQLQLKTQITEQEKVFNILEQAQNSLKTCQDAQEYLQAQKGKSLQIEGLKQQITTLKTAIDEQKKNLIEKISEKEKQSQQTETWHKQIEKLQSEINEKEKALATLSATEAQIEAIKEEGRACKSLGETLANEIENLDKERSKIDRKRTLMEKSPEGDCPTCGSKLTEAHRKEMLLQYDAELADLASKKIQKQTASNEIYTKRNKLLETFQDLDKQLKTLKDLPANVATLRNQLANFTQRIAEQKSFSNELILLKKQLEDDFFDDREKLLNKETELEAIDFDTARYEKSIAMAAKISLYENAIEEALSAQKSLAILLPQFKKGENERKIQQALLDTENYGTEIRAKIQSIEKEIVAIGFDEAVFLKLKAEEQRLKPYRASFQAILGADGEIEGLQKITQNIQQQTEKTNQNIDHLRLEITEKTIPESTFLALKQQLETAQQQLLSIEKEQQETLSEKSTLEEQLRVIYEKKAELIKIQSQNQTLTKNIKIHEGLATAFGRNGIPIIEIDRESPRITEFANEILRTLRSRSSVRINTQKDKADGGRMNVLEIEITDDQANTRPYEMFSGGEAFRINFALRIALAYALAARKGIQLRTLIIDEGFGTLDQEGIQAMRDAIYAIQERFDKILVITHLEELKDAFPTRIEVYKELSGSKFVVSS